MKVPNELPLLQPVSLKKVMLYADTILARRRRDGRLVFPRATILKVAVRCDNIVTVADRPIAKCEDVLQPRRFCLFSMDNKVRIGTILSYDLTIASCTCTIIFVVGATGWDMVGSIDETLMKTHRPRSQ